jgi:hypothetical protein
MHKSHIALLAVLVACGLAAGCSHVGSDWKAAQAADTTEAYQDFLRQHPDSEFGVQAQERVKQLAEERDWQAAAKLDTLDAYQQFVAAHADGKWAQEARVRIENLQMGAGGQPAPPSSGPVQAQAAMPATPAPAAAAATMAPGATQAPSPAVQHAAATPVKPAKPAGHAPAASAPKPASSAPTSGGGHHHVQLGAFGSRGHAESAWKKLAAKHAKDLAGLEPHYASAHDKSGKAITRLQVTVAGTQGAHELCAALKRHGQSCIVVD